MKNLRFYGMLVLLLTFGFVLAGCTTVDDLSRVPDLSSYGKFYDVPTPGKDFTSLGLIFVEKSYEKDAKGGGKGEVLTYYALLEKAKELGGDYIVNVTIDVVSEGTNNYNTITQKRGEFIKGKQTYYGAAVAIKYTDTLKTDYHVGSANSPSSGGGGGAAEEGGDGLFSKLRKK
jgi:hypothetical protein